MRDESQCVPQVQDADASGGKDRAAEASRCLVQQSKAKKLSSAPDATPVQSEVGAARDPITPGWDQRPGADLPHVDRLACGRIHNVGVVAPKSAKIALRMVPIAIVTAFGLGFFCGSTWYSSRTSGANILSRTVSVPLRHASGKRTALITGSIAAPVGRSRSSSPAEPRKAPFPAAEMSDLSPTSTLAEQNTASHAPTASDIEPGSRLMPFPETRPATINRWSVRDVDGEVAVLVGTDGVWTVKPGDYVPGVGRIDSITRWGSSWIVVTTGGLISTQ
jgi:hypothetical protein